MGRMKRLVTKVRDWRRRSSEYDTTIPGHHVDSAERRVPTSCSAPTEEKIQNCGPGQVNKISIEDLPAEIRYQILHLLGYDDARALVRASVFFHAQYLQDRKQLLNRYASFLLGTTALDACVAYRSGSMPAEELQTASGVTLVLRRYQRERLLELCPHPITTLTEDHATDPDSITSLTGDQVADLLGFHVRVVRPLVQRYSKWAWSNIPIKVNLASKQDKPTRTEEVRMFRAFYRFQICCNLFGYGRALEGKPKHPSPNWHAVEILVSFLNLFEPFEAEEVACVYAFAKHHFDRIFKDVVSYLSDRSSKAEKTRHQLMSWDLRINGERRCFLLEGTTAAGLGLLHAALCCGQDHQTLVRVMRDNVYFLHHPFLGDALGKEAQLTRRRHFYYPGDGRQHSGERMDFRGDESRSLLDVNPPLAWVLLWHRRYSNLFGDYIPDTMKHWGYVMWDQDVFEEPDLEDAMGIQWVKVRGTWDHRDPNRLLLYA